MLNKIFLTQRRKDAKLFEINANDRIAHIKYFVQLPHAMQTLITIFVFFAPLRLCVKNTVQEMLR